MKLVDCNDKGIYDDSKLNYAFYLSDKVIEERKKDNSINDSCRLKNFESLNQRVEKIFGDEDIWKAINSKKHKMKSDNVLKKIAPKLLGSKFEVEKNKKHQVKIKLNDDKFKEAFFTRVKKLYANKNKEIKNENINNASVVIKKTAYNKEIVEGTLNDTPDASYHIEIKNNKIVSIEVSNGIYQYSNDTIKLPSDINDVDIKEHTKEFRVDAINIDDGIVIEIEAGRAVANYQFLKDMMECSMISAQAISNGVNILYEVEGKAERGKSPKLEKSLFLVIAVRNKYLTSNDYKNVKRWLNTFAISGLDLNLKGILLIGY